MPTTDLARHPVTTLGDSHQAQQMQPRMWIESERDSGRHGSREGALVPVRPTPRTDAVGSTTSKYGDHSDSRVRTSGPVATIRLDVLLGIIRRGSVPNVAGHTQVVRARTSELRLKLREGR